MTHQKATRVRLERNGKELSALDTIVESLKWDYENPQRTLGYLTPGDSQPEGEFRVVASLELIISAEEVYRFEDEFSIGSVGETEIEIGTEELAILVRGEFEVLHMSEPQVWIDDGYLKFRLVLEGRTPYVCDELY